MHRVAHHQVRLVLIGVVVEELLIGLADERRGVRGPDVDHRRGIEGRADAEGVRGRGAGVRLRAGGAVGGAACVDEPGALGASSGIFIVTS